MPSNQSDTDDKIEALLGRIQQQKDAIAELERPSYKTNLTFSFVDGDTSRTHNLHTVSSVATLIKMAAHVQAQARDYLATAAILLSEDKVPPFLWNGFSAADWVHDIQILIRRCALKAERDKLAAMEEALRKIMSPERKAQQTIADIERQLG